MHLGRWSRVSWTKFSNNVRKCHVTVLVRILICVRGRPPGELYSEAQKIRSVLSDAIYQMPDVQSGYAKIEDQNNLGRIVEKMIYRNLNH